MTTNINPYQQTMGQPYAMNPVITSQPQQQKAAQEVNAVKIELIEPKAYGSAPNEAGAYYTYPQSSVYKPNGMMYPYVLQPFQPQMPMTMPAPVSVPQAPAAQPPMPQVPPAVVDQPTAPETPQQVDTQVPPAPVATDAPAAQPAATPVQQQGSDVNKLVQDLGSNDLEAQFNAINKIAETAQTQSPEAANLLAVDIFKGLASVVNKDTTTLEAPTQEQTALREKALSGQQLTPEEQAKAEQLAPQEVAEMNKQYALYTLAILQNSYRDAVNKELQEQGMQPAKINELPEINLVIDTIKNNPNALIREAGISALSYVVRPEDKEVAKTVFTLATQDSDENVKKAATDALAKIGEPVQAAAPVEAGKEEAPKAVQQPENVKQGESKPEGEKAA